MRAAVYHKIDDDNIFDPYVPGQAVERVFEFEVDTPTAPNISKLAERAYMAFNGFPAEGWRRYSEDYYALELRSLFLGDLVVFGEVAFAVERLGWKVVSIPSEVTS